jgi:hypothetical protein
VRCAGKEAFDVHSLALHKFSFEMWVGIFFGNGGALMMPPLKRAR